MVPQRFKTSATFRYPYSFVLNFFLAPEKIEIQPELCVRKSNSLKIRWKSVSQIPVSEYHIIYRSEDADEWTTFPLTSTEGDETDDVSGHVDRSEAVIEGLNSDTSYEVCVIGLNLAGQSPDEDASVFLRTALPGYI